MADSKLLTDDNDFKVVFKALYDCTVKWWAIGIELDISKVKLDRIKEVVGTDDEQGLREMVTTWLKAQNLKPTWQSLVAALRDKTIHEEALAAEIEEKYVKPRKKMPPNEKKTIPSRDQERILTEDDLPDLLGLIPVHLAYPLGLHLKLGVSKVTTFQKQSLGDLSKFLTFVLSDWVSPSSPPATLDSLVDALSRAPISNCVLAAEIEKKYKPGNKTPPKQKKSLPRKHYQGQDRVLSEDDLPDLLGLIPAHLAYQLGIQLKLGVSKVTTLQEQSFGDLSRFMRLVLLDWVSPSSPPATLDSLVDALSRAPINNEILAESLQEKFS